MMTETRIIAFRPSHRRRGFTLVELLVVIGIALLLMGIVLPAINVAYSRSVRTKMALDLQAIVTALEAYRQDHGDIPRTSPSGAAVTRTGDGALPTAGTDGAVILARALLGPGDEANDGAAGPGFRTISPTVTISRIQGPYLDPEKFKLVRPSTSGTYLAPNPAVPAELNNACLADRNGKPILYYPGIRNAVVTTAYVGSAAWPLGTAAKPMFNARDNTSGTGDTANPYPVKKLRLLLGDCDWNYDTDVAGPGFANGLIDGGEQARFKGDFLLISAGPDETFGPANLTRPIGPRNLCDDVANFDRSTIE